MIDGDFMKKEKVSSFDKLLDFIKANSADFTDLINCCRNIHVLVFDYNSLCFLESSDKASDSNKTSLSDQIDSEINKIIEKIKASFEVEGFELNPNAVFNEVIMPLSEVVDK